MHSHQPTYIQGARSVGRFLYVRSYYKGPPRVSYQLAVLRFQSDVEYIVYIQSSKAQHSNTICIAFKCETSQKLSREKKKFQNAERSKNIALQLFQLVDFEKLSCSLAARNLFQRTGLYFFLNFFFRDSRIYTQEVFVLVEVAVGSNDFR